MEIGRETWQAVEPLLDEALALPRAEREPWLQHIDATRPEFAPLLRVLLAAHTDAEDQGIETASFLSRGARPEADALAFAPRQTIGPYTLLHPIGRGGMGEVWLARQAEGGITRDVALKLPLLLGRAGQWRERFRRERDILARLLHPNIATLFDAGVAEAKGDDAAQPYLAMEFVDGQTLTEFADTQGLGLRERIRLFRQALAAVAFAHRQLVVHRDIKPANLLVTRDGQVKLLDFGIAKLLADDTEGHAADDLTRQAGRMLTLRYAAPEQVRGEPATTTADIYASGIVLHELLTGLSPYAGVRNGAGLRPEDVLDPAWELPSTLAPEGVRKTLRGDLDAILQKALRRDPTERYGSIEQFDEDLRRYLENQPVHARRGNRRYALGRFAMRHRLPLTAAALLMASLVAGLFAVEHERRIAVEERTRAQRHFASVRTLANTFIYDIEEDLRGLPGTLPTRKKLAQTSITYLDSLAAESHGDPALMAEVAGGYRRLADVFAGTGNGSLGNTTAAIENVRKALQLLDGIGDYGKDQRRILDDRRHLHYELSGLYGAAHDPRWETESLEALSIARRLAEGPDAKPADRVMVAALILEHVYKAWLIDRKPPRASPLLTESVDRLKAVTPEVGRDNRARGNLAIGYFTLGELLRLPGATQADYARALEAFATAKDLMAAVERDLPDDVSYAAQGTMIRTSQAQALMGLARHAEAESQVAMALQEFTQELAKDAGNADLAAMRWDALTTGVESAYRAGQLALARTRAAQAWTDWGRLEPGSRDRLSDSAASRDTARYYGGLAMLEGTSAERAAGCLQLRQVKPGAFEGLDAALSRCPKKN